MGCSVDAHMRNHPRAITGFGNRQAHRTERPGVGVRPGWPRGGRPRPYGVRAWRPPGVLLTTHWQGMGVWRFAWSPAHTVSTPGCADRSGAWRSAPAMGPTTVRVRHVPSPGGLLGIQRSTSFRNGPPGGCAASGWHASAVPCAATRRRLRRPWHRPPAAPSHRHKDLPARVADPPGGQRQAPGGWHSSEFFQHLPGRLCWARGRALGPGTGRPCSAPGTKNSATAVAHRSPPANRKRQGKILSLQLSGRVPPASRDTLPVLIEPRRARRQRFGGGAIGLRRHERAARPPDPSPPVIGLGVNREPHLTGHD